MRLALPKTCLTRLLSGNPSPFSVALLLTIALATGAEAATSYIFWELPTPAITLDDDMNGLSVGNADRYLQAGERVELRVNLLNLTGMSTSGTISIATNDPYATVLAASQSFSDWPASTSQPFVFVVEAHPDTPERHEIPLTVTVRDASTQETLSCWLIAYRPLRVADVAIDDDSRGASRGNGDGAISPGETVELGIALQNLGRVTAPAVEATLGSSDPNVAEIPISSNRYGDLVPGQRTVCTFSFTATSRPTEPWHAMAFYLTVTDGQGRTKTLPFTVTTDVRRQQLTNLPGHQVRPVIYGERIIWTDYRQGKDSPVIYQYDLVDGTSAAAVSVKPFDGPPGRYDRESFGTELFEEQILYWEQQGGSGSPIRVLWFNGDTGLKRDIGMKASGLGISRSGATSSGERHPIAMWGDTIAWEEGRWTDRGGDAYHSFYDIRTDTTQTLPLIASEVGRFETCGGVDLFGRTFVGGAFTHFLGNPEVYWWDMTQPFPNDSSVFIDSRTNSHSPQDPAVYGTNVVYFSSNDDSGIFLYDLSTGQRRKITQTFVNELQSAPDIDEAHVIWIRRSPETAAASYVSFGDRFGVYPALQHDLMLYELSTGRELRLIKNIGLDVRDWSTSREDQGGMTAFLYGNRVTYDAAFEAGTSMDVFLATLLEHGNVPPVASAKLASQSQNVVQFLGSGKDEDGTIVSYAWDFRDGTTSYQQNPQHAFPRIGTYVAHLTVTDNQGARARDTKTVIVSDLTVTDTTPPIISNVQSSNITQTAATISWTTDEPADSLVQYGLTAGYGSVVGDGALLTSHALTFSGLAAATLYHYEVRSSDAAGNQALSGDATFTTLTAADTTPPSVMLTSPVTGASVPRNQMVTLTATASDNVGVAQVQFFVNDNLRCTDTTPPYTCAWQVPKSWGRTYRLQAKASDAAGNVGSSSVVKVTSR